jgi:26S proteasome regulatory subunit N4
MGLTLPSESSPAEHARALMARKDAIESEIAAQSDILRSNGATMQTPSLVDREGFPRADIDIWAVRTARVRIIELRNDLAAVTDAIGKALEVVYERRPIPSQEDSAAGPSSSNREILQESSSLKPFAKVNSVAPTSPAAEAVSAACALYWELGLIELHCRACNVMILS